MLVNCFISNSKWNVCSFYISISNNFFMDNVCTTYNKILNIMSLISRDPFINYISGSVSNLHLCTNNLFTVNIDFGYIHEFVNHLNCVCSSVFFDCEFNIVCLYISTVFRSNCFSQSICCIPS